MNVLVLPERQIILVDTHVNENPTAGQLAEITRLAAEKMRRFGYGGRVSPCYRTPVSVQQQ